MWRFGQFAIQSTIEYLWQLSFCPSTIDLHNFLLANLDALPDFPINIFDRYQSEIKEQYIGSVESNR